ncbi:MAG: hypothetical protein ACE5GA_04325 [Candidatus Zixiibacteriota bacterium]
MDRADKSILPSDVRSNFEAYQGQFTHWVGVIDTFMIESVQNYYVLTIVLDQKYYDYIEDFSIQQERMFVSPKGEGRYYYRKFLADIHPDSAKSELGVLAARQNLGFCYGEIVSLKDGDPVLRGGRIRFVHEAVYATNIFSYVVERDSLGRVVVGKDGFPSLVDFEVLKIAGPGKND